MDVLLTGAGSFIGAHVAARLHAAGHQVFATYRGSNERVLQLGRADGVHTVPVDLACADDFDRLPAAMDAVVHVAGVSNHGDEDIRPMIACNVSGTQNLVAYALRAEASRLVYMSSLSVHGRISVPVVDCDTPVVDPDVYGASKYLGERMIAAVSDRLASVALRLPGVVGPGAHRAWMPSIAEAMLSDEAVNFYNPEAAFNNVVHVQDVAELTATLLVGDHTGFSALPLGTRDHLRVREVVELLRDELGSRSDLNASEVEQPGFTISTDPACDTFGFDPMPIVKTVKRYAQELKTSA